MRRHGGSYIVDQPGGEPRRVIEEPAATAAAKAETAKPAAREPRHQPKSKTSGAAK
jgi:hypothetical protein